MKASPSTANKVGNGLLTAAVFLALAYVTIMPNSWKAPINNVWKNTHTHQTVAAPAPTTTSTSVIPVAMPVQIPPTPKTADVEQAAKVEAMTVEQQAKAATVANAPLPTTTTTHLPAVAPKKQLMIRGVWMPDDCQDPAENGLQNLVTYVEQHNDPAKPGYVADADVAGYVCGWN